MPCLCQLLAGDLELHPSCIGHVWVFENLSAEDMEALANAAMRKRYAPGDVIVTQGQQAREMFLIKAGRVKLTKVTDDGQEMTLDIRQGGDFIGREHAQ